MTFEILLAGGHEIAVFTSDDILVSNERDALDLIANAPTAWIVLQARNFADDYFDLSTRKLGDVLQKCANYRVRLALVGDFGRYPSTSLKELIRESNRHGDYLFVSSVDEAVAIWSR